LYYGVINHKQKQVAVGRSATVIIPMLGLGAYLPGEDRILFRGHSHKKTTELLKTFSILFNYYVYHSYVEITEKDLMEMEKNE